MRVAAAVALVVALALTACAPDSTPRKSSGAVHQMGERVQAGPLIYTVLEADWHNDLSTSTSVRIPKQKFLVIRLSITNAGNREVSIPLLWLEDESGQETIELDDGSGVSEWMGVLRSVGPAATEMGRVVFDVAARNYRLRVTDGGEPGREITALVGIPLRIQETMPAVPIPTQPAPIR